MKECSWLKSLTGTSTGQRQVGEASVGAARRRTASNVGLRRVAHIGLGDGAGEAGHQVDVAVVDALVGTIVDELRPGSLRRRRERHAATSKTGGEDAVPALDGRQVY